MGQAWYLLLLSALTGAVVGSFLNVLIDRLPLGQSLVFPPSHCASCLHPLRPLDLVPILSYLWLRGRCRYCGASIPRRLPVVELLTALLFALAVYRLGLSPEGGVAVALIALYIAIAVIDLERGLILDRLVYPAAALALLVAPISPAGQGQGPLRALGESALAGALGFLVMLLIYLVARGGMGAGDVKLAGQVGLALGLPGVVVAGLLAFISGGLVAVVLLALRVRGRRDAIPYGPFLAGAAIATLLYGPTIYQWYRGFFLLG